MICERNCIDAILFSAIGLKRKQIKKKKSSREREKEDAKAEKERKLSQIVAQLEEKDRTLEAANLEMDKLREKSKE